MFFLYNNTNNYSMEVNTHTIKQLYDILELDSSNETYDWTVIPAGKPWKMYIDVSNGVMSMDKLCNTSVFLVSGKWITSKLFCIVSIPSVKAKESQQIISNILTTHDTYTYNTTNISVVTTQQMSNLSPAEFIGQLVDLYFIASKLYLRSISIGCIKQVSIKNKSINIYNLQCSSLVCVSLTSKECYDVYYIEPDRKYTLNVATYIDSKFMNYISGNNLRFVADDDAIANSDDDDNDDIISSNIARLLVNCKWNTEINKYELIPINNALYKFSIAI